MPRGLHARLCHAFIVTNLLLSLSVKEFQKSVSIWQCYQQKYTSTFFPGTVYIRIPFNCYFSYSHDNLIGFQLT